MRRFVLMSCVCAFALCPVAWAAEGVPVRTGTHNNYSRLVFDWPQPVVYTATRASSGSVEIEFKRSADMDMSGVDTKTATNILDIKKLSSPDQPLKVNVAIPDGAEFRHFLVGNKVVVDVYNVEKSGEFKEVTKKPPASEKEDTPDIPAMPAPAVEEKPPQDAPKPLQTFAATAEPIAITVSSTSQIGLAAFERNGELWIVADRSDIAVAPQVTGAQAKKFPPFEKMEVAGGAAWHAPLPAGVMAKGDGGGLVWKIILSNIPSAASALQPERIFEAGQTIRGGTLFWPMQRVTKVIDMTDPKTGDRLLVATVSQSDQFSGSARDFVDFNLLNSFVGAALIPQADDLEVTAQATGLRVSRPGGLAISRMRDVTQKIIAEQVAGTDEDKNPDAEGQAKRIFDFDRWMMGGIQALRENQQVILSGMADKDKTGRVQDLLMMAKMNLANDRGQEAFGLLNFASDEMPEIIESPEFLALRGAAATMAGKFGLAYRDFSAPALKDYAELDYWRAYTLAGLEDWQQAKENMPKDYKILQGYPRQIQERLSINLAEIALRSGNIIRAEDILRSLEKDRKLLKPSTVAGMDYLLGEKHRQAKGYAQAAELWKPLISGKDDFYRARSSLALTMLQQETKEITVDQAIDRLEGLRYHWRGDEIEAQTNLMLGKLYLQQQRHMKGFTILRDAISMSPDSDISKEIAAYMANSFKDLFLSNKINDLTSIDAITVYEEFRELTPPGEEGNRLIQRLAERLVDADLLGRAAELLQHQVDYRLTGKESADVGLRLAAVYLLNGEEALALKALDKVSAEYKAADSKSPEILQKQKEVEMLRARALSKQDKVEDSLAILNSFSPTPEINALRADIAWGAGMWDDAAMALKDMIVDESIDLGRPLTQKQADLILNRSVALNLAGDRVELANMRTKYGAAMEKTSRSKMFDVVTRPRTGNLSSDRDSIASLVSEVDMFREFLDSYRSSGKPSN